MIVNLGQHIPPCPQYFLQTRHLLHDYGNWCHETSSDIHQLQGEPGPEKTTLIDAQFSTELAGLKGYSRRHLKQLETSTEVEIIKAEVEEKQFKVQLSVMTDTSHMCDRSNNQRGQRRRTSGCMLACTSSVILVIRLSFLPCESSAYPLFLSSVISNH